MSENKKIAFITGANKGIGFETAKQLGLKGNTVYLGSRNIQRGEAAANQLKELGIDAHAIHLDLDQKETIQQAANFLEKEHGYVDILVSNAGIINPKDGVPSQTDIEVVKHTFEVNFFSALEVTQALLPLLKKAEAARIVYVSSGLGSLTLNADPTWEFDNVKLIGYNASKAAIDMLTVQLAWELKGTNIKVNATNPGYTDTDLVPGVIGAQPVANGAKSSVALSLLPEDGPNGGFYEIDGTVNVPW